MKYLRGRKKVIIIIVAVLLGLVIGAGAYYYLRANAIVAGITKSGSAADLLVPEALNSESTGTVNILIAGNSADDAGHDGSALTDSIIVANYNVSKRALTLISVPRDMYVSVNGSYMKINAAYPTGGMEALKQSVQEVTGLTINHTTLINYQAFKNMIDAVGGIDVDIQADDPRGINDPMIGFAITNGAHHLNGKDALLLARCRNDPTDDGRIAYGLSRGDFDRAANQRKIMEALLVKMNKLETITNPVTVQSLTESMNGNVTSDFTAGQLRRLYDISKSVASTSSIGLQGDDTHELLANYKSFTAGDALMPASGIGNYEAIHQFIAEKTSGATE